jgi:hypothetical protein
LGAIAILSFLTLLIGPRWQVRFQTGIKLEEPEAKPEERFNRINEARKTLAQILGGFLLLVGLNSTWQNLTLTRQPLAVSQQGQITDRFTKAIEQLGTADEDQKKHRKLMVRPGGIYALHRIADESERDRSAILAVLSAYVRENSPRTNYKPGLKGEALHPAARHQSCS